MTLKEEIKIKKHSTEYSLFIIANNAKVIMESLRTQIIILAIIGIVLCLK